jgi:hypothetical protein
MPLLYAAQEFLEASLLEIPAMLKAAGTFNGSSSTAAAGAAGEAAAPAGLPSYAVITDGQPSSSWKVIPGMGHDSCLMCTLMGQLANEPGAAGPVGNDCCTHSVQVFCAYVGFVTVGN